MAWALACIYQYPTCAWVLFLQTWGTITLAYSSLGIIYGDIGTSPLYCFATTLYGLETPVQADVLGVASLIFWIMTLIVLVKYVLIVLQADDNGEGELQQHCSIIHSSRAPQHMCMLLGSTCRSLLMHNTTHNSCMFLVKAISCLNCMLYSYRLQVVPLHFTHFCVAALG